MPLRLMQRWLGLLHAIPEQRPITAELQIPPLPVFEGVSACAQALLQSLLQIDPAQRPTAAAVCQDPWALDLPESPCDTFDCSTWDNPYQPAMTQEEPGHPRHESEDGPAEEQHAVECTAQAMQHLWLQQEALMNGARLLGGCRRVHSVSAYAAQLVVRLLIPSP